MRILMIAPFISPHSRKPLRRLLEQGHEVIALDSHNPFPEGRERFFFVPFPAENANTSIDILRRIWSELKPDIAHVHWIDLRAYLCVLAGIRPLVLSAWGSDINEHFNPEWDAPERKFIGSILRGCDAVIVDAADVPERCATLAGTDVLTVMAPLGVDPAVFHPGYEAAAARLRQSLRIDPNERVLVAIRALHPFHNHHRILEAFSKALPQLQSPVVLLFKTFNAVSFKPYEMELRRLAIEYRVQDSVRFAGELAPEDMPALYSLAHAVINFPDFDAFPVSFIEAAFCERPVISPNLPAYSGDFAETLLTRFDSDRPETLAAAIAQVVNAPPEISRRAAARTIAVASYTETAYIEKVEQLYSTLHNRYK